MNDFHIKFSITDCGDFRDFSWMKESDSFLNSKLTSQRCVYKDPELSLVGTVRLYNRKSIRQELGGDIALQISDYSLLALSYKQWGIECLNKLVGDFSFVLFDHEFQRLMCARDHLGVKQLYYKIDSENILSISSSMKDIVRKGVDSPQGLDKDVLLDYLLGLLPDQNKTLFSSILQLPPGHYFILYKNEIKVRKYWNLKISSASWFLGKKFHKERFLDLFEKVLRDRWGDKKNILLFSGGLDSTAILCGLRLLVKIKKEYLSLLSQINPQSSENIDGGDKEYIHIAVKKMGMKVTYSKESNDELKETTLMKYFDENFRIPWSPLIANISPLEILFKNKSDCDVFSGMGGDELVSLDPKHKEIYLCLSGRWLSLYKVLQREKATTGKSVFKNFLHKVLFRLLPDTLQEKYRRFRGVPVFDVIKSSFINPRYMSKTELVNYSRRKNGWWKQKKIYDPRKEIKMAAESGYFAPTLEHASAISHRSRCNFNMPFLDRRIIEFCLSVPGIEFVRNGVPRSFLRNCMHGYMPEEIENRSSKQPISHTDDVSMIINNKLFWSLVSQRDGSVWKIIDRERLIAAYNDLQDGKVRKKDRPVLGYQISKCVNVAAFYKWLEQKNEL